MPDEWATMPESKPNDKVSVRPGDWIIYNGAADMAELNRIHRNRRRLDIAVTVTVTLILSIIIALFV